MPQFTTISPTYLAGQKQEAWNRFREGGYVAIGWAKVGDLTGKQPGEISDIIRREYPDDIREAIESFERFLSLRPGDYVAVNNVNHGLFGIGIVQSGYKFDPRKHPISDPDRRDYCFPH